MNDGKAEMSAAQSAAERELEALRQRVAELEIVARERAASEACFRAIYESSHDAIMLLDEKGFFDCNTRTLELFRIASKKDFTAVHPADLSPPCQPDGRDSWPRGERDDTDCLPAWLSPLRMGASPSGSAWTFRRTCCSRPSSWTGKRCCRPRCAISPMPRRPRRLCEPMKNSFAWCLRTRPSACRSQIWMDVTCA